MEKPSAAMTSIVTTPGKQRTGSKTASTRLLDLLAGWSAYVSTDEETNVQDHALSAEDISELYQLAGQESERWEGLSDAEEEKAVSAFVNERVIPLLVRGRGDARPSGEG
jgi:hypothetical protein